MLNSKKMELENVLKWGIVKAEIVQEHNTGLAYSRSWAWSSALLRQAAAEPGPVGHTHIL